MAFAHSTKAVEATSETKRPAEAETTGDWYVAAWNLNQLIALDPDDTSLKERHVLAEAKLPE